MTTVLVTHDQEEALDVADRIAVLNKGRIEQVGDPVDALRAPGQRLRHGRSSARWPGSAASWCARTTSCSSATARPRWRSTPTVPDSPGVVAAVVERVVPLGFEVRVDLRDRLRASGSPRRSPARDAAELQLREGETVHARAVGRSSVVEHDPALADLTPGRPDRGTSR